jgi:hypothetical protein
LSNSFTSFKVEISKTLFTNQPNGVILLHPVITKSKLAFAELFIALLCCFVALELQLLRQ